MKEETDNLTLIRTLANALIQRGEGEVLEIPYSDVNIGTTLSAYMHKLGYLVSTYQYLDTSFPDGVKYVYEARIIGKIT